MKLLPISLIIFDIDYYKNYNDTYGHLAGDNCLRIISKRIQSYNADPLYFAARYGGEEFAIILLQKTENEALIIAEDIRKAIHSLRIPHMSSPVDDYVTVSIGVATVIPDEHISPNYLISIADEALYTSKQKGRNKVTQYTGNLASIN